MAQIFPFSAYRYNLERVHLADVITQPYDKISPAMQEHYAEVSPYNLISIEKGKPNPDDSSLDNVYTRAERALTEWIRGRILVRDASPAIYVYFQNYTIPGTTEQLVRKSFTALGRIEDYSAGVIFRHEQTLAGPKADRLELLRHTRTQTGQLFMLYTDPARRVDLLLDSAARSAPIAEAHDEYGTLHRLWAILDKKWIASVVHAMAAEKLVIADGHHRYETARTYRDECRARSARQDPDAPSEKAMMTLVNTRSEGLTILPTHRVVAHLPDFDEEDFRQKLAPAFSQQAYSFGSDTARAVTYSKFRHELAAHPREERVIGMYTSGVFHLLRLHRDADLATLLPDVPPVLRELDLVLLHHLMLQKGLGITSAALESERNITYEREMDAAIAAVDRGEAQVCFLLNPVEVEQVMQIALAGEVLPQKSTDFYPKLLSGLTLYRLE
jgi:uncharacterized protein (DUF1015 family)